TTPALCNPPLSKSFLIFSLVPSYPHNMTFGPFPRLSSPAILHSHAAPHWRTEENRYPCKSDATTFSKLSAPAPTGASFAHTTRLSTALSPSNFSPQHSPGATLATSS